MVRILQAFSKYLQIFFRYLLVPVLVSIYFIRLSYPEEGMYRIIYILSISALVGYWTNYFAIKMLFRPKEKTILGFQGVVPANIKTFSQIYGSMPCGQMFDLALASIAQRNGLISNSFCSVKLDAKGNLGVIHHS